MRKTTPQEKAQRGLTGASHTGRSIRGDTAPASVPAQTRPSAQPEARV